MPLQKILFKPGVNRENTRYTTEGGWYDCDKIRFRQGTPEKIGGWVRISENFFLGVCRSLWNWVTLGGLNLLGIGTNLKFYIESGGVYNDITPLRTTTALGTNPFTGNGTTTVTVTATAHGSTTNDFVTFSGVTGTYASLLNANFQITVLTADTYTITTSSAVAAGATGGAAVSAAYEISVGSATSVPLIGWGAGGWGLGTWGNGVVGTTQLRLWNQNNFGENLIFGPAGAAIYIWQANTSLTSRGVLLSSLPGASSVPLYQNSMLISDASRFVLAFGTNDVGSSTLDPMLIRWSDQENALEWAPSITNQAGSLRLSHGSKIVSTLQSRQEILVWTDASLYSLQYLGPPYVWGSQLLSDNISIVGPNAAAIASGVVYWMGIDKFYKYDGRSQTLRCDLREYIFSDINQDQYAQVFASTNEGFNEIWFFYCSANSSTIDKYAVYNYSEDIWYYGYMARTAWLDSGLRGYPLAATYSYNIVNHELGVDDNTIAAVLPIEAFITSSEFDIGDGHNFGFVWRILPDLTFRNSTAANPQATMYLIPLQNSGSGYNNPPSVGGSDNGVVSRTAVIPVEQFTGQINTRVRGRQMAFKINSNAVGVTWQLGAPRMDIRPDGRRGG